MAGNPFNPVLLNQALVQALIEQNRSEDENGNGDDDKERKRAGLLRRALVSPGSFVQGAAGGLTGLAGRGIEALGAEQVGGALRSSGERLVTGAEQMRERLGQPETLPEKAINIGSQILAEGAIGLATGGPTAAVRGLGRAAPAASRLVKSLAAGVGAAPAAGAIEAGLPAEESLLGAVAPKAAENPVLRGGAGAATALVASPLADAFITGGRSVLKGLAGKARPPGRGLEQQLEASLKQTKPSRTAERPITKSAFEAKLRGEPDLTPEDVRRLRQEATTPAGRDGLEQAAELPETTMQPITPNEVDAANKMLPVPEELPPAPSSTTGPIRTFFQQANQLRRSAMLLNPRNRTRDFASNTSYEILETAKDPVAALADRTLAATQTGQRVKLAPTAGTVKGQVVGAVKGSRDILDELGINHLGTALVDTFRRGGQPLDALDAWQRQMRTLPREGGKYIDIIEEGRLPGEINNAFGDFFSKLGIKGAIISDKLVRPIARARTLDTTARAVAKNEGLEGAEAAARVAALKENPLDWMEIYAQEEASRVAFMAENVVSKMMKNLSQNPQHGAGADFIQWVEPFTRANSNRAEAILRFSPGTSYIMAAREYRKFKTLLKADLTSEAVPLAQARAVDQIGRAVTGTAGAAGLGGAFALGLTNWDRITPRWAGNTQQEAAAASQIDRPFGAIEIGGRFFDIAPLGPIGDQIILGAEIGRRVSENGVAGITQFIETPLSAAAEQLPIGSITDLYGYLTEREGPLKDSKFERIKQRYATSFVPGIVREIARAKDPLQREKEGPIEAIQEQIPGLRERLPERLDIFGEAVEEPLSATQRFLDPTQTRPVEQDRLKREMSRVGYTPRPPSGPRAEWDETEEQYHRRRQYYGREIRGVIEDVIRSDEYLEASDEQRKTLLSRAVNRRRSALTRQLKETLGIE